MRAMGQMPAVPGARAGAMGVWPSVTTGPPESRAGVRRRLVVPANKEQSLKSNGIASTDAERGGESELSSVRQSTLASRH